MILKFIYNRYKTQIHNLLIEDLLSSIPSKVGKPAIEILDNKRETVVKWLYFEANAVSRRPPTDFGNLERRNGILILIQALIVAFTPVLPNLKQGKKNGTTKKVPDWKVGVGAFVPPKPHVDKSEPVPPKP